MTRKRVRKAKAAVRITRGRDFLKSTTQQGRRGRSQGTLTEKKDRKSPVEKNKRGGPSRLCGEVISGERYKSRTSEWSPIEGRA